MFTYIGECEGNNDKLNKIIQNAFDAAKLNAISLFTVSDSVGSSILKGGTYAIVIPKYINQYCPIISLAYDNVGIRILYGSVIEGKFMGLSWT